MILYHHFARRQPAQTRHQVFVMEQGRSEDLHCRPDLQTRGGHLELLMSILEG